MWVSDLVNKWTCSYWLYSEWCVVFLVVHDIPFCSPVINIQCSNLATFMDCWSFIVVFSWFFWTYFYCFQGLIIYLFLLKWWFWLNSDLEVDALSEDNLHLFAFCSWLFFFWLRSFSCPKVWQILQPSHFSWCIVSWCNTLVFVWQGTWSKRTGHLWGHIFEVLKDLAVPRCPLVLLSLHNDHTKKAQMGAQNASVNRLGLSLSSFSWSRIPLAQTTVVTLCHGSQGTSIHGKTIFAIPTTDSDNITIPLFTRALVATSVAMCFL